MNDLDLVIAFRASPFLSPSASKIFNDKTILLTTCLLSLKEAVKDLKIKMHVILDRCPVLYEKIFNYLFEDVSFKHLKTHYIGRSWDMNVLTSKLQLKYLMQQNFSEIVLFQEDDYFYVSALTPALEFIQDASVDFISPIEIDPSWNKFLGRRIINANTEWIECPYTANTFLTKKSVLKEAQNIMEIYEKAGDLIRSLILTKNFKPVRFDLPYYRYRITSFIRFFNYYLTTRKFTIFMPNPPIALHMVYTIDDMIDENKKYQILNLKSKAEEIISSL